MLTPSRRLRRGVIKTVNAWRQPRLPSGRPQPLPLARYEKCVKNICFASNFLLLALNLDRAADTFATHSCRYIVATTTLYLNGISEQPLTPPSALTQPSRLEQLSPTRLLNYIYTHRMFEKKFK